MRIVTVHLKDLGVMIGSDHNIIESVWGIRKSNVPKRASIMKLVMNCGNACKGYEKGSRQIPYLVTSLCNSLPRPLADDVERAGDFSHY